MQKKEKHSYLVITVILLCVAVIVCAALLLSAGQKTDKVAAAKARLLQEDALKPYGFLLEDLRYSEIFLTEDDIPEIVLCDGDYHASQMYLYMYDGEEYRFSGVFSEYGSLQYLPRKNRLSCMYGGMGAFYFLTYEYSDENGWKLISSCAQADREAEIQYYLDYPVPETVITLDESEGDVSWSMVDERYRVSEEVYLAAMVMEEGYADLGYNDMLSWK